MNTTWWKRQPLDDNPAALFRTNASRMQGEVENMRSKFDRLQLQIGIDLRLEPQFVDQHEQLRFSRVHLMHQHG